MIFGGIVTFIFGLLSAFIQSSAFVLLVNDPISQVQNIYVQYGTWQPQLHAYTLGMLVSSVGGILGVVSSLRSSLKFLRLGFLGIFLGVLGFTFLSGQPQPLWERVTVEPYHTNYVLKVPWIGICLTLLGVLVMFTSYMYEAGGWYRLVIIGVPLLLLSWLLCPLLIGFWGVSPSLRSFFMNVRTNIWFGSLPVVGFTLIIGGTVLGFLKTFSLDFVTRRAAKLY